MSAVVVSGYGLAYFLRISPPPARSGRCWRWPSTRTRGARSIASAAGWGWSTVIGFGLGSGLARRWRDSRGSSARGIRARPLALASHHPRPRRRYGFLVACRSAAAIAWYARTKAMLAEHRPGAVLVSSDSNPEEVGFTAAAAALAVPRVFVSHAYPTPFSPPLNFNLSILEGEAAVRSRMRRGTVGGDVVLAGVEGDSAPLDLATIRSEGAGDWHLHAEGDFVADPRRRHQRLPARVRRQTDRDSLASEPARSDPAPAHAQRPLGHRGVADERSAGRRGTSMRLGDRRREQQRPPARTQARHTDRRRQRPGSLPGEPLGHVRIRGRGSGVSARPLAWRPSRATSSRRSSTTAGPSGSGSTTRRICARMPRFRPKFDTRSGVCSNPHRRSRLTGPAPRLTPGPRRDGRTRQLDDPDRGTVQSGGERRPARRPVPEPRRPAGRRDFAASRPLVARDLGRHDRADHLPAGAALLLGRAAGRTARQGRSVPAHAGRLRAERLPAGKVGRPRQELLRRHAQQHGGRRRAVDGGLRAIVRSVRADWLLSRLMADRPAAGRRHPSRVLVCARKHRRRVLPADHLRTCGLVRADDRARGGAAREAAEAPAAGRRLASAVASAGRAPSLDRVVLAGPLAHASDPDLALHPGALGSRPVHGGGQPFGRGADGRPAPVHVCGPGGTRRGAGGAAGSLHDARSRPQPWAY